MELFVDIADVSEVRKVAEYYPIDGFTTNPNLLAKGERSLNEKFEECRSFIRENEYKIFIQVTATEAEEMIKQAKKLREYFGKALVVKLPATKEGYKALQVCKRMGIPICITVIHSMLQALVAAKAGADYAAPYLSRIDNLGADGIREVEEMVNAFDRYHYPCKVLAASFRTAYQIERLAAVGCHAVTLPPQFFDMLIAHPSTDVTVEGFQKSWKEKFGDIEITDAIGE